MEFFKKYGTKERLYEMMNGVNKNLLKEGFDYNDAERDHLGQQDLEAQQADDLKAAQAKEPATDTAPIHPEHPDNTGNLMETSDKNFDPNDDGQVKELFILLSKDGIEDFREYYPDWVVDELQAYDYVIEDSLNGTYQWLFTDEGRARFPNPDALKKFLLSEYNQTKSFAPGEQAYLRGYEPGQ